MSDTAFTTMNQHYRPARGGWAPGGYFCTCRTCQGSFIGDKRATSCADCAYAKDTEVNTKWSTDTIPVINKLNEATIETLEKRIVELEAWIKAEGEHGDTCTYAILNKVCDGCRCEKRRTK